MKLGRLVTQEAWKWVRWVESCGRRELRWRCYCFGNASRTFRATLPGWSLVSKAVVFDLMAGWPVAGAHPQHPSQPYSRSSASPEPPRLFGSTRKTLSPFF